jgi:RimJ/RimL family protein N-acetyltransferase
MRDDPFDLTGPEPDSQNDTELATERLVLGFGRPEDADVLFPFVHGEAGREVTDTLLWDGPDEPAEMAEFFRLHTKGTFVPHGFHWLMRDRTGDLTGEAGRAIGSLGMRHVGPAGRCDVGYWLAPPYWGRGLMREALVAVIRHGFTNLRVAKFEADAYTHNDRSCALLAGLGFRREGTSRRRHRKRGSWVDAALYGLLPGELIETRA